MTFPSSKAKTNVFVIPAGHLSLIPLGALVTAEGDFLMETHNLILLSSAQDLVVPALGGEFSEPSLFCAPDYDHPRWIWLEQSGVDRLE